MQLVIRADYVTEIVTGSLCTIVIFNVENSNASEFTKGDTIESIHLEDESGPWVKNHNSTFISAKHSNFNAKHMVIEVVIDKNVKYATKE